MIENRKRGFCWYFGISAFILFLAFVTWIIINQYALLMDPLIDYEGAHEYAMDERFLIRFSFYFIKVFTLFLGHQIRTEFSSDNTAKELKSFVESYSICPLVGKIEVVIIDYSLLSPPLFKYSKTHCEVKFIKNQPSKFT